MIKDYASLRAAIADTLHRDDLVDFIPYFVQEAELEMNSLRVWHMETALSTAISSGVLAVPSGYLEMKFAYVNSATPQALTRTSAEEIYRMYPTRTATSIPTHFAREGTNFIFGPYPDSNYTIKGIYYARPAALDADTATNWAITHYPMYMLYTALSLAEPYLMNDSRLPIWKAMADSKKQQILNDELRESQSGSKLRARRA